MGRPRKWPEDRAKKFNVSLPPRAALALDWIARENKWNRGQTIEKLIHFELARQDTTIADKRFDPPKEQGRPSHRCTVCINEEGQECGMPLPCPDHGEEA